MTVKGYFRQSSAPNTVLRDKDRGPSISGPLTFQIGSQKSRFNEWRA